LKEFQRLDHATLPSGQRPLPSFGDEKIDAEEWFTKNDEMQKARSKDLAWWCQEYTMMINQFLN